MSQNIALLGGGTAGHIMPNLALYPELVKRFDKAIYIGSPSSMEEEICKMKNIPYYPTETMKFHRKKIWKNLRLPLVMIQGVKQAKSILKKEDISLVFSKGGYAAVPTVIAAHLLGIPVVCHESDRTMGLANRFTARFSERVYTAFPETYKKATVLPTPIREEIFAGKPLPLFRSNDKEILLFMGGSLGAEAINDALSQSYAELSDKYNIIHITGKHGIPLKSPSYIALPFAENIADYFATADLIVSRAGASTLGELTALGKRVIAVPLPKGESRGDQEENAAYYLSRGEISVLPQESLTAENLSAVIGDIIKKRPPAPAYDRDTPRRLAEELFAIARMKHIPPESIG